jgi:tRNA threonylcarbamoyl adenosine modification protein YjeE
VTLRGDLGTGKTTFAQAMCRGLGVTESVTSPTFALSHAYASPRARVTHCDLYRLESIRDVTSLGLDDVLADTGGVLIVEWPERAGTMLEQATLAVSLEHDPADPTVRIVTERWA